MRLLAAAIVVLAIAVVFVGVVTLRDGGDDGQSAAETVGETSLVSREAESLAAQYHVTPEVMEERLSIAASTCDVFKEVGAGYGYLANVCRFNVVSGNPWWDGMPPRQLRDVAEALIRATQ